MGSGGHSMSSAPHRHNISTHHVGGGRPMGGGMGHGAPPHGCFGGGGFFHGPEGHHPGHYSELPHGFGHGAGAPPLLHHHDMFHELPHGYHGHPCPPPPCHRHDDLIGHVIHHLFCQPPSGFMWRDKYFERSHFEYVLDLLRKMRCGYRLTFDEQNYVSSVMGCVPYDPRQIDDMIFWIEEELRHF